MKAFRFCVVMAAAACVVAPASFGQHMFGGPRDYGTAEMAKIFGKNQAFSAAADMSVVDAQMRSNLQMEMNYAFLKGDLRTDLDMSTMKGAKMPPAAVAQMKQMGMDKVATIYQGDKKVMYMMYPGLQSYCIVTPPQASDAEKAEAKAKVDVTEVGKETVDGHPCVKNKVVITTDAGSQHEMFTWNATDLNNFPIKTEMKTGNSTITTHFHDIKLTAPDASLFTPPSDYKSYPNMQEMMMANMAHMMPPGAGHPGGPPSE